MKILVGALVAESNASVEETVEIQDFTILKGEACVERMMVSELAEQEQVELIPSIFASAMGAGCVEYDTFEYLLKQFVKSVQAHAHEIDGIFLFLHGASYVNDLPGNSAEHVILKKIREVVGNYLPIAVVMDPHGNLSQEFADQCSILRTLRNSPHTDRVEAHQLTFRYLLDVLKNRRDLHPVYRKVPLLLGGERCVSADEPLRSINRLLDQIESDPRILCCSYHIGYLRHDSDKCGASIIVVPNRPEDYDYAVEKADEIYTFVWDHHKEFHFTGTAEEPDQALRSMIETQMKPAFLTDSGDNVTAGAGGGNTFVLRQVLGLSDYNQKRILFAGITDKKVCSQYLSKCEVGTRVEFELGKGQDCLTEKVPITGILISAGELHNHWHDLHVVGSCWTVELEDRPVTLIICDKHVSFAEKDQYEWANVVMENYDLIIVKQGYLYPELKEMAGTYVMSLTDGACMQRTERLTYKKVMRPIYPLDEI